MEAFLAPMAFRAGSLFLSAAVLFRLMVFVADISNKGRVHTDVFADFLCLSSFLFAVYCFWISLSGPVLAL